MLKAKSLKDAAEGLTFMKEMFKWNTLSDSENGVVAAGVKVNERILPGGPGHFGKDITGSDRFTGNPVAVDPIDACTPIVNKNDIAGKFGMAIRGQCTFAQKVRHIQEAGGTLAIILDNVKDSSHETTALFAMSGDGKDDIEIPAVFLFTLEGEYLKQAIAENPNVVVTIGELKSIKKQHEVGCDNDNCEIITNPAAVESDNASYEHLKKVLGQLVSQIEMSLTNEEPSKTCSEEIQHVQVSKDKFVNEEARSKACTTNCGVEDNDNVKNIMKPDDDF